MTTDGRELITTVKSLYTLLVFTARRYSTLPSLCVCPSVCLSQVGVVLKRLNVGSRSKRHTIAQRLFSGAKDLGKILTESDCHKLQGEIHLLRRRQVVFDTKQCRQDIDRQANHRWR